MIARVVREELNVKGAKRSMIKIKCQKNYQDRITKQIREAGKEYTETNERAEEIIKKGYAVFVEEIIEEATVKAEKETAMKKTNAKK